MNIGPYSMGNGLILAPMAGVTDRPFRTLCKKLGAAMTVSEMVYANPVLRNSRKTQLRMNHVGEPGVRWVQIAGADPVQMAEAAQYNADKGAQIIDINMGCPAKKVCNTSAGSALLGDEKLVARILESVVTSVTVPVTLKIRTGLDPARKNAVRIARIAEQSGVQALSIHGRTKACAFSGRAEYSTIREVVAALSIPVIANGDIQTPEEAKAVLQQTNAAAIMIGRAAQGRPWIFREIDHYLTTGDRLPEPEPGWVHGILREHVCNLHEFYGEHMGVRIARKHIAWYLKQWPNTDAVRTQVNTTESPARQLQVLESYFMRVGEFEGIAA